MAKYKTVKRKAEVGERILITDAISPFGTYCNGDVFTVSIKVTNGVRVHEHDTFILHEEYEVITENETEADGQMRSMKTRYDLALENALEAIEELRLAAYEQGYKDATAKAPIGRELTRDEIVEKAKHDVTDLLNEYQLSEKEVDVKREDLTVVCKIKHLFSGKELSKGIAKCAPDDCFNVHIGKAIALRRALGLEVPDEYLNAPQPTEVRVGDVIEIRWRNFEDTDPEYDKIDRVDIDNGKAWSVDGGFYLIKDIFEYDKEMIVRICDDSRDGDCE